MAGAAKRTMALTDNLFQKTLRDLIRSLRATQSAQQEKALLRKSFADAKKEVNSQEVLTKATALEKLVYLNMLGFDISSIEFHVVEVMSYPKVSYKCLGYRAAATAFHKDTEMILLAANLLKKELTGPDVTRASLAANCIAEIATAELAQTLIGDTFSLLARGHPVLQNKSVALLYQFFLADPDCLRPSFQRFMATLESEDVAVVTTAVSVLCELARFNPRNYLPLAPPLYHLLTNKASTWLLIKLMKLFSLLVPLEPRLGKKLVSPLTSIIQTTVAKSLLFECCKLVAIAIPQSPDLMRLCVGKLEDEFLGSGDSNLKYLGLSALSNLVNSFPDVVVQWSDSIFNCLDDVDPSIRKLALRVVKGLTRRDTAVASVEEMLKRAPGADVSFRNDLILSIITMCGEKRYELVQDFAWYVRALLTLAKLPGNAHGFVIGQQLRDISVRVPAVRGPLLEGVLEMISDPKLVTGPPKSAAVLVGTVWLTGEFGHEVLRSTSEATFEDALHALLMPGMATLPAPVQALYLQAVFKIWAAARADLVGTDDGELLLSKQTDLVNRNLNTLPLSESVEVRERVWILKCAMKYSAENPGVPLHILFEQALAPVGHRAAELVSPPEGLDLNTPMCDPALLEVERDVEGGDARAQPAETDKSVEGVTAELLTKPSPRQIIESQANARESLEQHRQQNAVFYLSPQGSSSLVHEDRTLAEQMDVAEDTSAAKVGSAAAKVPTPYAPVVASVLDDVLPGNARRERLVPDNEEPAQDGLGKSIDLLSPVEVTEEAPLPDRKKHKHHKAKKEKKEKRRKGDKESRHRRRPRDEATDVMQATEVTGPV